MAAGEPAPIVDLSRAAVLAKGAKSQGKRVVLTNGCFDLVHHGHAAFLQACARAGDYLVVGLNEDDSVRRLKGPGRPLASAMQRAQVLAALRWVDLVALFPQSTADALIEAIRPAVYAKGADYDQAAGGADLPELATAKRVGADVEFVPLVPGASTSALLRRISEARKGEAPD